MARVPRIEFSQNGGWNTLKHLLGEDTQQLPANVQGFEDSAVLVVALREITNKSISIYVNYDMFL